jgi:iron(III) transport system permease protein
MPSLLAAFVYSMVFAFREISAAIFLYSQGNEVVAVTIYDLWTNGAYPVVSALGVLMTIFLFGLVVIAQRFVRRMGIVVT